MSKHKKDVAGTVLTREQAEQILQPGDVMLAHKFDPANRGLSNAIIETAQRTPFAHAALYTGNRNFVHSTMGPGVEQGNLDRFNKEYDYRIYRPNVSNKQKSDAIAFAQRAAAERRGYDVGSNVSGWLPTHSVGTSIRNRSTVGRDSPKYNCGGLVAASYSGIPFAGGKKTTQVIPKDIANDPNFSMLGTVKQSSMRALLACTNELIALGTLPIVKLGEVSDEEAAKSLERYEALEKNKPTVGQAARYAAIGTVAGPVIRAVGQAVRGGRKSGVSVLGHLVGADLPGTGNALRSLASNAAGGAIGSGAIPLIRGQMDRQAEMGTLKKYMVERHKKDPEHQAAGKLSDPFVPVEKTSAMAYPNRAKGIRRIGELLTGSRARKLNAFEKAHLGRAEDVVARGERIRANNWKRFDASAQGERTRANTWKRSDTSGTPLPLSESFPHVDHVAKNNRSHYRALDAADEHYNRAQKAMHDAIYERRAIDDARGFAGAIGAGAGAVGVAGTAGVAIPLAIHHHKKKKKLQEKEKDSAMTGATPARPWDGSGGMYLNASFEGEKTARSRYEREIASGNIRRADVVPGLVVAPGAGNGRVKIRTREELSAPAVRGESELASTRALAAKKFQAQAMNVGSVANPPRIPTEVIGSPPGVGTLSITHPVFDDGGTITGAQGIILLPEGPGQKLRNNLINRSKLPWSAGPSSDAVLDHALLQHEVGELAEAGRHGPWAGERSGLGYNKHHGLEPTLRENLATTGDPEAQRVMAKLRESWLEDSRVQKLIKQVGGTPDSPIPLGGKQHRALERRLLALKATGPKWAGRLSKLAFETSMYDSGMSPPRTNQVSQIPSFRVPSLRKPFEIPEKNASMAVTPMGRAHAAQRVGLPHSTAGTPSIAQVSKPIGYGRAIPGATSGKSGV